jgi:glucose/arabinose dehydrogenase
MFRSKFFYSVCLFFLVVIPFTSKAQYFQSGDLSIPQGFRAELVAQDLAAPTMVTFDNQDRVIIAESGKGGGEPKVIRVEPNGSKTILVHGTDLGDQTPISGVAFHDGKIYISHAGTISLLEQDGKVLHPLIKGLPGNGDHPIGQMVFKGTVMYFTIGTATNSGVVGPDNVWTTTSKYKSDHDIPCKDLKITAETFGDKKKTSAFTSLESTQPKDTVIKSNIKCNGALLRANVDGTGLSVFASGFRNPFGLEIASDGNFYVTEQGMENKGLRPLANSQSCLYKVTEGQWFGWPDFNCSAALKKPVISNPPSSKLDKPLASFDQPMIPNGFAFAPSNDWGKSSEVFVAMNNGKIEKVDTIGGAMSDFSTGYVHPSDVTFSPRGEMYVTDRAGVVWKISKINQANPQSTVNEKFGLSLFMSFLQLAILGLLTWYFAKDKKMPRRKVQEGWRFGLIAGAATLIFMVILSMLYYKTPWFASIQLFNFLNIHQNLLTFQLRSFIPGLIFFFGLSAIFGVGFSYILRTTLLWRVLVSSLLYGLVVWAVMQYLILPNYSKEIIERSFPPTAFYISFLAFGLCLGYLFEQKQVQDLF